MTRWITVLVSVLLLLAACKTGKGGKCAKPDDCGSGLTCAANNTCQTPEGAKCVASKACQKSGNCTPGDADACVVGFDADCKQSDACKQYGECRRVSDPKGAVCAAVSRDDCAAAQRCREWGYCTPVKGTCEPASNDDCKAADACAKAGRCTYVTDLTTCMKETAGDENNFLVGSTFMGHFVGCCARSAPAPKPLPSAASLGASESEVRVRINTDPDGAEVAEDAVQICTSTPCDIVYKGKDGEPSAKHTVTVKMAGYKAVTKTFAVSDGPIFVKFSK